MAGYAGGVSDDRALSVDEALSEIAAITDRLDAMGPGDPGRTELIARRDELRQSVREASSASRSEDALRYELDKARRALAYIEARAAERSKSEKRTFRWINDPDSESNRINQMLRDQDLAQRQQLERRIGEIETQLGEDGAAGP